MPPANYNCDGSDTDPNAAALPCIRQNAEQCLRSAPLSWLTTQAETAAYANCDKPLCAPPTPHASPSPQSVHRPSSQSRRPSESSKADAQYKSSCAPPSTPPTPPEPLARFPNPARSSPRPGLK